MRNLASQPGYVAAMFDYGVESKSSPKGDKLELPMNKIALINVDSGELLHLIDVSNGMYQHQRRVAFQAACGGCMSTEALVLV